MAQQCTYRTRCTVGQAPESRLSLKSYPVALVFTSSRIALYRRF